MACSPKPHADQRGASAVEYALLLAGIAAVLVLMLVFFGDNVRDSFDESCKSVASATTCQSD